MAPKASSKNKASSSESKLPAPADDAVSPELDEKLAAKADVAGRVVTTADEFVNALAEGIAEHGPRLIEVQM